MTETCCRMNTIVNPEGNPNLGLAIEDAVEWGINDRGGYWKFVIDEDPDTKIWTVLIKDPQGAPYRIKFVKVEERTADFVRQVVDTRLPRQLKRSS